MRGSRKLIMGVSIIFLILNSLLNNKQNQQCFVKLIIYAEVKWRTIVHMMGVDRDTQAFLQYKITTVILFDGML